MSAAVLLLCAVAGATAASEVPFVAFGTSPLPDEGSHHIVFDRAADWLPALIASRNAHFFVFDEVRA
jgi:hypothetical protein